MACGRAPSSQQADGACALIGDEPRKLKAREVAEVRTQLRASQGNRCAICSLPFKALAPMDAVLDHDHATGAVRAVLHRGCNSLLGKLENGAGRYGVSDHLVQFCHGLGPYIRKHEVDNTGLIYPTHKTADEKRLLRNSRARKARAAKKKDVP